MYSPFYRYSFYLLREYNPNPADKKEKKLTQGFHCWSFSRRRIGDATRIRNTQYSRDKVVVLFINENYYFVGKNHCEELSAESPLHAGQSNIVIPAKLVPDSERAVVIHRTVIQSEKNL